MTPERFELLNAICPNLFEAHGDLTPDTLTKAGEPRTYRESKSGREFGARLVRNAIKAGYLSADLRVTEAGLLAVQDGLHK